MRWAATFGQKYNVRWHPIDMRISGSTFITFEAEDEAAARDWMFENYGDAWSFVYPYDMAFREDVRAFGLRELDIGEG